MRGDPIKCAIELGRKKAFQIHGNTKPTPIIQMPDFDAIFSVYTREPTYSVDSLCTTLAISASQARYFFGTKTLRANDFPASTEDAFIAAARGGLHIPERPWLEQLLTKEEASKIVSTVTGRRPTTLTNAVKSHDIPHYHFSNACIRIRRKDLQDFCLRLLRRKGIVR